MKTEFEKKYHNLEKDHFWFKARRAYILKAFKDADKQSKILDIGCSSGLILTELLALGFPAENLYGIDISEDAIKLCKTNGLHKVFVQDAQNIQLEEKFDIIIASDCLEHLEQDTKALENWHGLLKPNALAYIFVPAYRFLWSAHDTANMHFRRYTKKELNSKLSQSGFKILKSSYWNMLLFLPILLVRTLSKLKTSKSHTETGDLQNVPPFNGLLFQVLNFENKLLKHISFPFGVSVFSIVRKPKDEKIK